MIRLWPTFFYLILVVCFAGQGGCVAKPVVTSHLPEQQYVKPEIEAPVKVDAGAAVAEAPPQETEEEDRGAARPEQLFAANLERIEQRQSFYEGKLFEWKALDEQITSLDLTDNLPPQWQECILRLEKAYSAYVRLREQLLQADDTLPDTAGLVSVNDGFWMDIGYLESGCEEVFGEAKSSVSGFVSRFSDAAADEMEAMVIQYVSDGKNEQGIEAYRNLMFTYADRAVRTDTKRAYGFALVRTGQTVEAARILGGIEVDLMEEADVLYQRRTLADLLFVNGQLAAAQQEYNKLAEFYNSRKKDDFWIGDQLALLEIAGDSGPELTLYQSLLKSYLGFDGMRVPAEIREAVLKLEDQFPESLFTSRAREVLRQAEEDASFWVGRRLLYVDGLVEEKEFRKAIATLEELLAEDLPPEIRDVVQNALDDVFMAENQELQEQELLREQSQEVLWEEANRLLGLRQYDEAIAQFSLLLDTGYDEKAKAKINEAANSAAVNMRREAANIFVKARKATDPGQKKELMIESWRMLAAIPERYPQAEIIDKVLQNIKDLERQIRSIDPFLLDSILMQQEAEPGPLESNGESEVM